MNGFTIYKEYYELITLLSEREQQEILLAITRYMFEDIEPTLNDKQTKIFNNLRRPLDKSKKRSKSGSITNNNQNENKVETNDNQNEIKMKSNENQNSNQNENETKTHQDVNVIVNVNGIDNVNVKDIIDYLNFKSNSHFKYSSEKTKSLIKARINDGFTIEDFKTVIDNKTSEWIGTDFEKFLRPETLFSNKFEGYLNQKITQKKKTLKDISMTDLDRAIELEKERNKI